MKVTVTAQARLHFGFTNLTPQLGNVYGSIGVALDNPCARVTAIPAERFSAHGSKARQVEEYANLLADYHGVRWKARVEVEKTINSHSGLGSGTQMALATASALLKLHGMPLRMREAAGAMERGLRSGVGIAAFETGGCILDAGHPQLERPESITPSSVLVRHDMPEGWRFILFLPTVKPGLSGSEESSVFTQLGETKEITSAICQKVMLEMLPALVNNDIRAFGQALTAIDTLTGMYFHKAQGGTYRERLAENAVDALLSGGAYGVGQSSWGPCLYALADEKTSESVILAAEKFKLDYGVDGEVIEAVPSNRGATIRVTDD